MSLALSASLTLVGASGELARISRLAAEQGPEVVVDCSALQELDSACVAVLLQCRREALARGQAFRLDRAPAKLKSLMALYGVAELFDGASLPPPDSAAP